LNNNIYSLFFVSVLFQDLRDHIVQEHESTPRQRRLAQDMAFDLWREADLKPTFTFLLRPRMIQAGIGVKLICCLSGRPVPKVSWYKNGGLISESNSHYDATFINGVCTLQIPSCRHDDSGNYTCKAENPLGFDETTCMLVVEGRLSCLGILIYIFIQSRLNSSSMHIQEAIKNRKPKALLIELNEKRSVTPMPKQPRNEAPRFYRKIASYKSHAIGESTSLKCQFSGVPAPTAQWLKNGEV
jgi:hypothetical protein